MPHVREKGIDLCVAAAVVHWQHSMVLLIHHKKLDGWFMPGGHVGDLDPYESTDEALCREVKEETGLVIGHTVRIWQPPWQQRIQSAINGLYGPINHGAKSLWVPWAVDLHEFPPLPGHKHLALIYLLEACTADIKLEQDAHSGIRWFTTRELDLTDMLETARAYGHLAIDTIHPSLARV